MENKISSVIELRESIVLLEVKRKEEGIALKQEFRDTLESLRPINMIKETFHDFKENLLGNTLGLAAGYASKAIVVGTSVSPVKRILGSLVQLGISKIVEKNPDGIKSAIGSIVGFFRKKKNGAVLHETAEHNY